jgi:hypothetical protein
VNDERRPEAAPDDDVHDHNTAPKPDLEGANLQIPLRRTAPLHVSPLPGEFSTDEILDMQFVDRPLPFLTRDDVVFEGTSTLLAAREKGGKSTLIRYLSHAWVTDGRSVLYLSEEWRRVWRRQLEALGVEKGAGHFQVIESLGKSPQELLNRAAGGPETIVIVDTVTWLLGISLANRDQVVEGLTPWVQLCGAGKTLILLAHLTKRGEIEGSHAFGAGVETLVVYRGVDGQDDLRTVEVRSRMLADSQPPFAIRKSGSTFSVEDVPHELTLTNPQAEVLEVLPTDPAQAKSWEEVAAATGFKEGKTRKALRDLVNLRLVEEITGTPGGRGNVARYVALEQES